MTLLSNIAGAVEFLYGSGCNVWVTTLGGQFRVVPDWGVVSGGMNQLPVEGIEPTLPKEHDFESCASANSATPACEV